MLPLQPSKPNPRAVGTMLSAEVLVLNCPAEKVGSSMVNNAIPLAEMVTLAKDLFAIKNAPPITKMQVRNVLSLKPTLKEYPTDISTIAIKHMKKLVVASHGTDTSCPSARLISTLLATFASQAVLRI